MYSIEQLAIQIQNIRTTALNEAKSLSIAQLNFIPAGFNNNIAWNIGHIIATQQTICYFRCGLPYSIDKNLISSFGTGTKPEKLVSWEEFERLEVLLTATIDQLLSDYTNHIFKGYASLRTGYNIRITNINEAIAFLPFHEGIHLGAIMTLKRFILSR